MSDEALKGWTRMLTLGLAELPAPPGQVRAWTRDGLCLRLSDSSGQDLQLRFHLQPGRQGPRAATDILQGPREGPQETWVTSILDRAGRLAPRSDWIDFLQDAGGLRFSSGQAFSLRLTRSCNARCSFCNASGELHDLAENTERRRLLIAQAAASGAALISFTGGEPTLLPDLADWIRRAKSAGIERVELQTNGILLADAEKLDELCEAGLDHVLLSLHAGRAEIHDAMLALPGAFAAIEKMMASGEARKLEFTVNCVLCRDNLRALGELLERLAAWGVPRLMLSYVSADALRPEHLELMPPLSEAARAMEAAITQGKSSGISVRIPGLCGVPMCMLPAALVEHFDEYQDTRAAPRIPSRRYADCCAKCSLRPRCSGFWRAYLDRFGEAELQAR